MARREYKYLVDEPTIDRVRNEIAGICVPDEHAREGRYLTDTLYLDTLALHLYRATVENERVREKLRIRKYPGADTVFLEVKRRVGDVIVKHRAELPVATWADVLESVDFERAPGAAEFLGRYHRRIYVPQVIVRYDREPYASTIDHYARVTFDRRIEASACSSLAFEEGSWSPIDAGLVVLEMKFEGNAPPWMQRIIRKLELPRLSFSKYARAIDAVRRALPRDEHPLNAIAR